MKTFVLYRPEREARVVAALAAAGIAHARLWLGPEPSAVPAGCTLTAPEVACWRGHWGIVGRVAMESPDEPTLVLEDDFLPVPRQNWRDYLTVLLDLSLIHI